MEVTLSGVITVSCSTTIEVDDGISDYEIIRLASGLEDVIFENEFNGRFKKEYYGQWVISNDGTPYDITIETKVKK